MVVVPLSKPVMDAVKSPVAVESECRNWVGMIAGGTLAAAALLLFSGQRRAGMVAAATGTSLALLDQKDTLHTWWDSLPVYIEQVQTVLGQVQDAVSEVDHKRESLRQAFSR